MRILGIPGARLYCNWSGDGTRNLEVSMHHSTAHSPHTLPTTARPRALPARGPLPSRMRELAFLAPGRLAWREVPTPRLQGDGEALVRPLAVARCDLDRAILRGEAPFRGALLHWLRNHLPDAIGQQRLFRNAPFKGPYAFGHECVAEVLAVGDAVHGVQPGDRVLVPFQISCGDCARCRHGLTASCTSVPARSMYGFGALGGHGWGGVLSECVRVPFADAMLVPLPAGADPAALASAGDNVGDGWRTVAPHLAARPGATVLVVGGGAVSVGLYAAACAVALGAERVDYVDQDPTRLQIAARLGATTIDAPFTAERPSLYPITVDASADPTGLTRALLSTEPGGTCTSVGIYYTPDTPMPLRSMYGTGITFITGRVHARAVLPSVLELTCCGRLHPELVTTVTASWDDAPEALLDSGPKVVITR
ncbi:MAG: alcohol dehydrogenase catalytic domain-containing protein [Deltaproteobacteria bacterium]|nr:alcohol dehydrogenase catalytic domain-containing protein [Deltaproteobacteria bacterium]